MNRLQQSIASLHPGYFAMVMATGIVSIAAQLRGFRPIALGLFGLNVGMYLLLWGLLVIRVVHYRERFLADLNDHNRSVGFFTTIAGTCVLGNQFVVVVELPRIAMGLWYLGIALWGVVTYTILLLLTVKQKKPTLEAGINGGWLVAVVAAQAVSVLGGLLAPHFTQAREEVLFFTLVMWLGGGMLYIWIIALIFYRYTFFPFDPATLAPPYWINMGAMAISTLAGAILISNVPHMSLLADLLPFLQGFTLLFWSTATWWIPLLVLLGIWRHGVHRFPLRYEAVYWSAVFPLGMYTACTHRMSQVLDAPFLMPIPHVLIFLALAAWAVTFLGLIHGLLRRERPPKEIT